MTNLQKQSQIKNLDFWNDSCTKADLEYAIENGAVGVTTNPPLYLSALKTDMDRWEGDLKQLIKDNPTDTDDQIAWKIVEKITTFGAGMLHPIYEKTDGMKGKLSMQVNPKNYRNAQAMVEQALHFSSLADNIQVKIPATKAGIEAMEEATYRGVQVNATVSFTVPQTYQVAEAIERGLKRREAEGLPIDHMTPVCTIMVGRLDDYLKDVMKRDGLMLDPEIYEWAGVAVAKRAYKLYKEKGYRVTLLFGAYRNHLHWSQILGEDTKVTIGHAWQVKINNCSIEVKSRINDPVNENYLKQLMTIEDFRKAYEPDGMVPADFDHYGAVIKTLKGFMGNYDDLVALVRSYMLV